MCRAATRTSAATSSVRMVIYEYANRTGRKSRPRQCPRELLSSHARMRSVVPLALGLVALSSVTSFGREPRVFRLRFPRFQVVAGTNPEACVAVRVPTSVPFDIARIDIRQRGARRPVAVQHFLVYVYTGDQLAALPEDRGAPVPSRG